MSECSECKYFFETPADPSQAAQQQQQKSGSCRRYPPSVIGQVVQHPITRQPALMMQTVRAVVAPTEFCGEFVQQSRLLS